MFRKDAQSSIVVGGDMASTDKAVAKKVEERNRTVTATAKTVTETRAESAAARSKQVRNTSITYLQIIVYLFTGVASNQILGVQKGLKSPLVGETLFSYIPPSNFLVSVLDP